MTSDDTQSIRLAVLSDLHCQNILDEQKDSFLLAGALRSPSGQHPVQALIERIEEDKLTADVIVCPGDLTNKICTAGMSQAWDHLHEIKRSMCASDVVVTIGNHDVDSRKKRNSDPFFVPRSLRKDFPFAANELNDQYWANGFCTIDIGESLRFLVINSAVDHNDEKSAMRGSFSDSRLERLVSKISSLSPRAINIAVLHHHPMLHSLPNIQNEDVLSNGDDILNALAANHFRLVIHGHRHHPKLTSYPTPNGDVVVFAAGSFSRILHEMGSYTRNLFHLVTITQQTYDTSRPCGWVNSWEFNYGVGWNPSTSRSAGISHRVGFGATFRVSLSNDIASILSKSGSRYLALNEFVDRYVELTYLLPDDFYRLCESLRGDFSIKPVFDGGNLQGFGFLSG